MNYIFNIDIKKIFLLLKNKKISNYELIQECLKNINNIKKKNNFFIKIFKFESLKLAKKIDKLKKFTFSIPLIIKDIYCNKFYNCTNNSLILKNFLPKYNSKINKIFNINKINIIGKCLLEEFCLGESGMDKNYHIKNPFNKKKYIGGSSNGSSLSLCYSTCFFSISSDTGGSSRTPSSYCNNVGYKPTYGIISREGMLPYSSYLDCCSIISNTSENCKIIFNLLNNNNFDLSSHNKFIYYKKEIIKIINIIFFEELFYDIELKKIFEKNILLLKNNGFNIFYIKIKNFKIYNTLYDIVSSKEFYLNNSKYDGLNYGFNNFIFKNINDLIKNNRIFNYNCKNKIIKGINNFNYYKIDNINYYFEALFKDFKNIFKKSDILIIPNNIIKNIYKEKYSLYFDYLTTFSNLIGLPSINLQMNFINHTPIGMQIISKKFYDNYLLNFSILIQKIIKNNNVSI